MNSTIYKWDGKRFKPIQYIRTNKARQWKYFNVESEHFLAVANEGLPSGNPEALSKIYRWHRKLKKFVIHQFIQTVSARSIETFTIGGRLFLVIANYASQRSYRTLSWVYMWSPESEAFIKYQHLDTTGAFDVEYFQIGDEHFLAIANSYNGVTTRVDSIIYHWRQLNFIPLQYIETIGAVDWEYFTISGYHYLAVANMWSYSAPNQNTYEVNSVIYQYDPELRHFVILQELPTYGARDVEFFTVGQDAFIIIASSTEENRQLENIIYRWQGLEHFVPVHNISTQPSSDWEDFTTDEGEKYLVSANAKTKHNKLLRLVTY